MNTCQTNILFKAFLDSFIRTSQKPPYLDHLLLQSLATSPFSPLNFPGNLLKMNELLKSRSFATSAEPKPTDQQTSTVSKTPTEKSSEDPPKRTAPQKETLLLTRPPEIKIEEQPSIKIEEQLPAERPHRTEQKIMPKQQQPSISKSEALDYIQNILAFLVKNVGRVRGTKLKVEGEKLHENIESIKEIYDGLMNKFMISNKTKEEKIKYVLRKSFKFMKEALMIKNGMSLETENDAAVKKQIENMFFEHYFSEKNQEALSSKDYANIKDIIMPFRKNSQNKTMNTEFLKKIFSFEKFLNDYLLFLKNFKEIAAKDNKEKLMKTSKKIADLMATRQYKEFSQKYFKRMPWLEVWVEEAENIARRLVDTLPKKELKDGEQIIKKPCLESNKKPEELKRNRANSI